jgi:hypothetical protein
MSLYSPLEPIQNVLDGDPEAAKLFDILVAKGVKTAGCSFQYEEGETWVRELSLRGDKGRSIPINVVLELRETAGFDTVIGDGLLKSLVYVDFWDEDLTIAGNVWIDVEARRIYLSELETLGSLDPLSGVEIVL